MQNRKLGSNSGCDAFFVAGSWQIQQCSSQYRKYQGPLLFAEESVPVLGWLRRR